jgi:hypothetical protein
MDIDECIAGFATLGVTEVEFEMMLEQSENRFS